jgi:hypothetical protein
MNPMLVLFVVTLAAIYLAFNPNVLFRAGLVVAHGFGRVLTLQDGLLAQRVNRSDPEKLFVTVFQSYSTAAGSNGQAYIWDFGTDKDGLGVTRPTARATNAGMATAGILAEAVLAGAYGLMQVYGYHSAVRCRTVTGGSPAIVAGRPLIINIAGSVFCLESISTASKQIVSWPCGFAFGATSGFTTAAIAAFIKAL